jgi:2-polyprenyl-3-methyl-5-hydroxy-6-metoxy-1,4-benzoquinol methylase
MLDQFIKKNDYKCWCGSVQGNVVCKQLHLGRKFVVMECWDCHTYRIIPKAIQSKEDCINLYNTKLVSNCISKLPISQQQDIAFQTIKRIENVGIKIDDTMYVLDVGCSDGFKINVIQNKYHCSAVGIDVNKKAIIEAQHNYPLVKFYSGLISEVNLEKNSFDVVIASAIIEHVDEPVKFLGALNQYLKPNGILYILTPNSGSILFSLIRGLWRELLALGEHVFLFDYNSLKRCSAEAGFEIVTCYSDYDDTILNFSATDIKSSLLSVFIKPLKWLCKIILSTYNGDILNAKLKVIRKT